MLMISFILSVLILGSQAENVEPKCSSPGECTDGLTIKELEAGSEKVSKKEKMILFSIDIFCLRNV